MLPIVEAAPDIARRVSALEKMCTKLDGKLDSVLSLLQQQQSPTEQQPEHRSDSSRRSCCRGFNGQALELDTPMASPQKGGKAAAAFAAAAVKLRQCGSSDLSESSAPSSSRQSRQRVLASSTGEAEHLLHKFRQHEQAKRDADLKHKQWAAAHPRIGAAILMPGSRVGKAWAALQLVLVLFSLVMSPIDVAFQITAWNVYMRAANMAIDTLFLLDVAVGFLSAYSKKGPNETIVVVRTPGPIARHYAANGLFSNLLAAVPVDAILWSSSDAEGALWWHALKLLHFFRILKLRRLGHVLAVKNVMHELRVRLGHSILRLCILVLVLIYIFHFIGCIYLVLVRHHIVSVRQPSIEVGPAAAAATALLANRESSRLLRRCSRCHHPGCYPTLLATGTGQPTPSTTSGYPTICWT